VHGEAKMLGSVTHLFWLQCAVSPRGGRGSRSTAGHNGYNDAGSSAREELAATEPKWVVVDVKI
jgi:hypothetical protein